MQKNTPARKALASTVWFQHKHPQVGVVGRITTAKRYHQFQAYVKEIVKNEKFREIILANKNELSAGKQFVEYLLKKTGTPKKAIEELQRIRLTEIEDPFKHTRFELYRTIIKHARKTKIPVEKIKNYTKETNHIIASSHQELIAVLDLAEIELEKMIKE